MASMTVPDSSASPDVQNASASPRENPPPAETSTVSRVPEPAQPNNGVDNTDRDRKAEPLSIESRINQNSELLATGRVSIKSELPPRGDKLGRDAHDAEKGESRPVREEKSSKTPRRDEATVDSKSQKEAASRRPSDTQQPAETAPSSTRKHINGTIGSAYSGSKIRHLKKDDGIPLWRKDIQYDFLRCVFEDRTPCFTRFSEGDKNLTFADLYLDTMAKSSKTSKILKDKLQNDRPAAMNIAMVCLLVNFGRMNTTLNFFPEMRAQLRTYHSIPSLQARQDASAYKQLQDAPRLKSILKGASEDVEQPTTIKKIKSLPVPRTNPVNLLFVLAQHAPQISRLHFQPPGDFFDLIMRPTLSSRSRAKAFLWLMWLYLESDFSEKAALENPFGPGIVVKKGDEVLLQVPGMEELTEEEAEAENVDPADEVQYGEDKQRERKRILEDDDVIFRHVKRPKKDYASDDAGSEAGAPSKGEKSTAGRRSDAHGITTSFTPLNPAKRALEDEDVGENTPTQPRPRAKRAKRDSSTNRPPGTQPQRLVLKTRMEQTPDTSSPAPPGAGHPILNQYSSANTPNGQGTGSRRPRPMTQHQLALEQNRKQRVDYALAQRRAETWETLRARRENEVPFARAGRLLQSLPAGYDTDDENAWGEGGICPNPAEEEDYGEAASFYFSVVRKVARRLQRWDWDSVLSDDKDYPANGLGVEYNRPRDVIEHQELEVIEQQQTPTVSSKPRGGRTGVRRERKAAGVGATAGAETPTDAPSRQAAPTKKPMGRPSTSGKRGSGDKTGVKRTRTRNRPSKLVAKATAAAAAADADEPGVLETPDVSMVVDEADQSASHTVGQILDDVDKSLLGEESIADTRSRMDDASSIGVGPELPPGDDDDTEELSDVDVDMDVSKFGADVDVDVDVDSGGEEGSLSPEHDDADADGDVSRLDDDETMVDT